MENNKSININEIIKNGGATLDFKGCNIQKNEGFMASFWGSEIKLKLEKVDAIEEEVLKRLEENKKRYNVYTGLWVDDGYMYIDNSMLFNDEVEALEFAKKNKQLAIYDIKNNNSIYLKDYNFIKYYTLYQVVYNDNNDIIDYKIIKQYDNINKIINDIEIKKQNIKNALCFESLGKIQVLDNKWRITKDFMLLNELVNS